MIEREKVIFEGHTFGITYVYPGDWMDQFPLSVGQIVQVYYVPKWSMKESEVTTLYNRAESQILLKIREHIESNAKAFEKLEINYRFNGSGFNIDASRPNKMVICFTANLDTSLKAQSD